ncbi:hypothetical protein INT43_002655, partial [Umbelopsis isabellina]
MHYILAKRRLEKYNQEIPGMTSQERWGLLNECLQTVNDPEVWFTGWFRRGGSKEQPGIRDIREGNVREWLAWAFWGKSLEDVDSNPDQAEELNKVVDEVFAKLGYQLADGYNANLTCIRLNLDPIKSSYRPLCIYIAVYILTYMFNYTFMNRGFYRYEDGSLAQSWDKIIKADVRDATEAFTPNLPAPGGLIVHWHRPATKKTNEAPIFFIHGIAAGLMCYNRFINQLIKNCGDHRGLVFLEMPYVSMHINQRIPTTQVLVKEVQKILAVHGYEKAIFMGHSLGSCVVNWIVQDIPQHVAGVTLIDPVIYLLHYSDLAYNFVHRTPTTPNELLINFFAAQELYTAFYIARRFDWNSNMMFVGRRDDTTIINRYGQEAVHLKDFHVFISENDNLIDCQRTARYLLSNKIDCHVMPGLDHATFLFKTTWGETITGLYS